MASQKSLRNVGLTISEHFKGVSSYAMKPAAILVHDAVVGYLLKPDAKYAIKPAVVGVNNPSPLDVTTQANNWVTFNTKGGKRVKDFDSYGRKLLNDLAANGLEAHVAGLVSYKLARLHPDVTPDEAFIKENFEYVHMRSAPLDYDVMVQLIQYYAAMGRLPMVRFLLFVLRTENLEGFLADYSQLLPDKFDTLPENNVHKGSEQALIFILLALGYDPFYGPEIGKDISKCPPVTTKRINAYLNLHAGKGSDIDQNYVLPSIKKPEEKDLIIRSIVDTMADVKLKSHVVPIPRDHEDWQYEVMWHHAKLAGIHDALSRFVVFAHHKHATVINFTDICVDRLIHKPDSYIPMFTLRYLTKLIEREPEKADEYTEIRNKLTVALLTVVAGYTAKNIMEYSPQLVAIMKFITEHSLHNCMPDYNILTSVTKSLADSHPAENVVAVYSYLRGIDMETQYVGFRYTTDLEEEVDPDLYQQLAKLNI